MAPVRRRLLLLAALVTLSIVALLLRRSRVAALGTATDRPSGFSAGPVPLPSGRAGDLLRTTPSPLPPGLPAGTTARRILYRSVDHDGHPTAVTGLLYVPGHPEPSGRPLIATFGHGSVGISDGCAPSRFPLPPDLLAALLAKGLVVVASDYAGLGTPTAYRYLAGPSTGHNILDAARAAQRALAAEDGGAPGSVLIYGMSAGGHAALWAAQEATAYAPELDVVATVALAPVGELGATMARFSASLDYSRFALMLGASWAGWKPGLVVEDVFPPGAERWLSGLGNRCPGVPYDRILPTSLDERLAPGWFRVPQWAAALAANSPGHRRITHPVLLVQGTRDDVIPADSTNSLQVALAATGTPVERIDVDADHLQVPPTAAAAVVAWVEKVIAATGQPVK